MHATGFTGTRTGLTPEQQKSLGLLLRVLKGKGLEEAHQGCCVGADEAFALACRDLWVRVVGHPGDVPSLASAAALAACDLVLPAKPNLARNRDVVDAGADCLVACPAGPEVPRSGTWAAVRHARKLSRRVVILWPDGSQSMENWPGRRER